MQSKKPQRGTADALKGGLTKISPHIKNVLSVYGDDSAFYTPDLIKSLVKKHRSAQADITFVTINLENPTGLGRIIRNNEGKVTTIVEEKNATEEQKKITEINTGLYIFNKQFLDKNIDKIKKNQISGEYYLTDLIEIGLKGGYKVQTLKWNDSSIWFGINTKGQLDRAKQLKRQKEYAI